MADQGISNRETPQEEHREREEFPPHDPALREHNRRSDEKGMKAADGDDEFEQSEDDLTDNESS